MEQPTLFMSATAETLKLTNKLKNDELFIKDVSTKKSLVSCGMLRKQKIEPKLSKN